MLAHTTDTVTRMLLKAYLPTDTTEPPDTLARFRKLSAVGDFTKNLGGNANSSLGGLKA